MDFCNNFNFLKHCIKISFIFICEGFFYGFLNFTFEMNASSLILP